jgi:hypothetical protein
MTDVQKIENIFDRMISVVEKLSEKYGSETVNVLLETSSMMATNQLIQAFLSVLVGISLLVISYRMISYEEKQNDYGESLKQGLFPIFGILLSLFSIVSIIIGIGNLVNPITWKGVTSPKHYIAYQLIKKVNE